MKYKYLNISRLLIEKRAIVHIILHRYKFVINVESSGSKVLYNVNTCEKLEN